MSTYTVHEAKTKLSKLLAAVEAGDEVIIARGSTPVARLVRIEPKARRVFGAYRGLATVTEEFFEPLPDDEYAEWEGAHVAPPPSAPLSIGDKAARAVNSRRKPKPTQIP